MKPYVWRGESGRWYLAMGKHPTAILKSVLCGTWRDAMHAAHALIAREPS